jgi:hypothetical protein
MIAYFKHNSRTFFDILHIPIHQENYYEPKIKLWSQTGNIFWTQSILDFPAITKDDIDYHKIFTDVREKK